MKSYTFAFITAIIGAISCEAGFWVVGILLIVVAYYVAVHRYLTPTQGQ